MGFFEGALNRVRVARGANGPRPYICQIVKPRGHAALCPPYRSLISAFCRLQREGRLTGAQYQSIKRDLMADIADVLVCDTTPQVIAHAVKALESGPLRGMDAIHLGAALGCAAEVFVSADARQCEAAERFGLRVVAL